MKTRTWFTGFSFLISLQLLSAAPEAFEVGAHNKESLPKGKEADGIVGDFILRNDRVEAVISGDLPLRRANMSTFYGDAGITPGCLYDLTLRDANNDQITVFTPSRQQGDVSYVRVVKDGSDGEAVVETVMTAAGNGQLYRKHEYRLKDGWQGVLMATTLLNESGQDKNVDTSDRWTNFSSQGETGDIRWADAVDPADRAGYAVSWVEHEGSKAPASKVTLKPGQSLTYARFLAVGRSPAEAVGVVRAWQGPTGTLRGRVNGPNGKPTLAARVNIPTGQGKTVPAHVDEEGRFEVGLSPGKHELTLSDIGRPTLSHAVTIEAGQAVEWNPVMEDASGFTLNVRDEEGKSIPCKAQFIGIDGTRSPDLGPANRAHGCRDQYHSESGTFSVPLPPGKYRVVITRGIEYSHHEEEVELKAGTRLKVDAALRRLVDTTGWVSADFHNHSTPSGDNTCGTDDRIINLAAEHIEFAPTTEHNRLYDWNPHIARLGLQKEMFTIPGIELTGSGPHFNSFPFKPDPWAQDGGAPVWNKDPRVTAVTLRDFQGLNPERWLQINHPDMIANFIDRDGDGQADGGFLTLGQLIDGLEVVNGNATAYVLADSPYLLSKNRDGQETYRVLSEFVWLQLLNRGHRHWCIAVSDAHSVHGNGVGGWRMFLPSSTDEPSKIDYSEIVRNAKAGRSIVTTGPFLQVRTEDGTIAGGDTRGLNGVRLHVKVQCTDWIDIDRVQVLVNGRQRPDLNFTRASHPDWFKEGVVRFDRAIDVALSEDSHLIVVAIGENHTLATGFGSSTQARWKPAAYNNPIFVDVDGGGFTPNGDTLGWDLPVKGLKVSDIKAMMQ